MSLIGAFEAVLDLAVVNFHVTCGPFEGLNAGPLVEADHQGLLWRIQIQADNISRSCRELNVCDAALSTTLIRVNPHIQRVQSAGTPSWPSPYAELA